MVHWWTERCRRRDILQAWAGEWRPRTKGQKSGPTEPVMEENSYMQKVDEADHDARKEFRGSWMDDFLYSIGCI